MRNAIYFMTAALLCELLTGCTAPEQTGEAHTCTFSITCADVLNHLSALNPEKQDILPEDGILFPTQEVTFYEGESVFDVLQRICKEYHIHMEFSWTAAYDSAYIEGIGNLYEFDCGSLSGWKYRVNNWYPNYGCSQYLLTEGDAVTILYLCESEEIEESSS